MKISAKEMLSIDTITLTQFLQLFDQSLIYIFESESKVDGILHEDYSTQIRIH